MTVAILKKLSMKSLVGDVKALLRVNSRVDAKGEPIPLAEGDVLWLGRVVGIGKGLKTGESNFGPWTAILGDFQVVGYEGTGKGKTFRTGQIFLPEVIENMVAPVVGNLDKGSTMAFAFDVGIKANKESVTGYEYTAAFVKEPEDSDPLALLVKDTLALPAPGAVEEKPAETETKEAAKK